MPGENCTVYGCESKRMQSGGTPEWLGEIKRARDSDQGRVVRKPVNANLGLKVNRSIDFS